MLPNPDVQVIKLLEKLLLIYMKFFDQKIFNESKLAIVSKDALPDLIN